MSGMNSNLSKITADRIQNREIVIDSILGELEKLKGRLMESKGAIKNNNTLNLGSEELLPNAVGITNSFNALTMLMGIYRLSDFSKEGIDNTKDILLNLQGQINTTVGKEMEKELAEANLGGGSRKRGPKKSRKHPK
jgi:hypothetical protein